ncbi:MAG: single-stranded DNA-binding protein [Clostridia bacterium]|nr:single-stranded DNA-binding protein [Clostridia bacterium]
MNNAILTGRLTADPELKKTTSGTSVVRFRIAVRRRGSKDKTDFLPCTAWGNTAEFIFKYLSKGSPISVSGSLQVEEWKDKDGNNRTSIFVNVEEAESFRQTDHSSPVPDQPTDNSSTEKPSETPVQAASGSVDVLQNEYFGHEEELPF